MGYLFMRGRARATVGLAAMGVGSLVVVGGLSGAAAANGGPDGNDDDWQSHWVDDSQECTDALGDQPEFSVETDSGEETPDDGHYRDAATGYEFDVDFSQHDGHPFMSFDSNAPVDALYIQSEDGCLVYEHPQGLEQGEELPSPGDSIDRVGFGCGGRHHGSTTTSSTTSSSTTSSSTTSSSTTTSSTTSTTEAPTSSTSSSTTTTVAPTTASTTPSGGGTLPFTGSNTGLMVAVGAGLLAAGGALVATARIRRNRTV